MLRPSRRTVLSAAVGSSLAALLRPARGLFGADVADPAPPTPADLPAAPAAERAKNADAAFHAAPKPLPDGAAVHEWPSFLGPNHNMVCGETKLLAKLPENGPKLVWETARGEGYAAPAVLGERVVHFHRVANQEVVECLHAGTGERYWRVTWGSRYRDRYGYSGGPRCSPVIGGEAGKEHVYALGVEGKLHCIELATGRVRWKRDLLNEFAIKQNFFGVGSTPLIEAGKLIINVGAPKGPCVAAFDLMTGKMLWGAAAKGWGPSYASPVPATIHGKRRVLVFAGGETDLGEAVSGGLVCLDPENGAVDFTFDWRGDRRESVNASSPLVVDGNRVLVSECYGAGGALVEIDAAMKAKPVWTNKTFGTHFMVAVQQGEHLYGVDGHGPQDAVLCCVEAKTGKELWRTQPEWKEMLGERQITIGTYRAWLMPVDGRWLMLGEFGHLLWAELTPQGYKEQSRGKLFAASETWTPPVLSRGLLYICQNNPDRVSGTGARLLCYDLRG